MRPIKKILFMCLVIGLLTSFSYSVSLKVFGSYNSFLSNGDASDYVIGENEFPITDSHNSSGFGLSVSSNPFGSVFMGVEVDYNLKSTAVIEDPSDNDTAEIDTYKHILGFFTLGYRFIKSAKISIFTQGGVGIFYLLDENYTDSYITTNNYILEIEPADQKIGFSGFLGAGFELMLSGTFGIVISGRYLYIASEDPQAAIVTQVGLRFIL
jgi:hypothetical protein